MAGTFNNPERLPPMRVLRRTLVVGKKPQSRFAQKVSAQVIASQIIEKGSSQNTAFNKIVADTAKEAVRDLSNSIRKGRVDVDPNSPEYAAWKARTGQGQHPLTATAEYARSVTSVEVRPGLHRVTVRNGKHRGSGIELGRLSRILEEGTYDGIPARPHFAAAARKAKQRLRERLSRFNTAQDKAITTGAHRTQRLRP